MLEINGFPKLTDYIELPDLPELLRSPIMVQISAEDAWKHGGELVRRLLGVTPLKNDKKYISVTSQIQYLTPEFSSVRSEVKPAGDWHVDASGLNSDDTNYLLLNGTDCNTEFNSNPLIIEQFTPETSQSEFVRFINHNDIGIQAQMLEGNRIATFGCRDIHRAVNAKRPTLRFMWRVSESNSLKPVAVSKDSFGISHVFKYKTMFPNIEQVNDGVIIYK
ncbi:hypothetical protein [Paenibacillus xylanexedens]|uniref:hypothetical protein n=1 Tax=Paenibacillus xylanexedens TaxID=528191 RepID=UPI000F527506|nr:hypothetical protein [Paenibacillus xylanexedens]RPK20054.1 hypothetical protein EDO6_06571 [Paenibacillus xylanexedens]